MEVPVEALREIMTHWEALARLCGFGPRLDWIRSSRAASPADKANAIKDIVKFYEGMTVGAGGSMRSKPSGACGMWDTCGKVRPFGDPGLWAPARLFFQVAEATELSLQPEDWQQQYGAFNWKLDCVSLGRGKGWKSAAMLSGSVSELWSAVSVRLRCEPMLSATIGLGRLGFFFRCEGEPPVMPSYQLTRHIHKREVGQSSVRWHEDWFQREQQFLGAYRQLHLTPKGFTVPVHREIDLYAAVLGNTIVMGIVDGETESWTCACGPELTALRSSRSAGNMPISIRMVVGTATVSGVRTYRFS